MPRARNDFWTPDDEWALDDDHPDADASPERDHCTGCGRYAPPGSECQGPGPYPRPCPWNRPMPRTVAR